MLKTKFFTSLDKIYPEMDWSGETAGKGTMLANERFSFQLAYCYEGYPADVRVEVTPACEAVSLRRVGLVPAEYLRPFDADDNFEKTLPGLFPDPLLPLKEGNMLHLCANGANALWFTVEGSLLAEKNVDIRIRFVQGCGEEEQELASAVYALTVLPYELPEQKTLFTQWFHSDCLSGWYEAPVLSEKWWSVVEQYVACAAKNGMNLILTPIFTPPLDTAVGSYRTRVQLVTVRKNQNIWEFDFSNLHRWIALCLKNGMTHFEISHLFTQWGAAFTPAIYAETENGEERVFGWDVDANSEAYKEFLKAFLPELMAFLEKEGVLEACFFHVSDEPNEAQLETYRYANELIREYIGSNRIMDAISDYAFYEKGLIDLPVCATDHIQPFLEKEVKPLFGYYCCAQTRKVANRLFGMPQVRNRCIGIQIYSQKLEGFLQWGFNYWLSPGSRGRINPYRVTDCCGTFPAGDSFSVYPSEDGPVESARMVVFYEALQDVRLLTLLEEKFGRQRVEELLTEWDYTAFDTCPSNPEEFLALRERLLAELVK